MPYADPEQARLNKLAWRHRNREKVNEASRKYREAHPERAKAAEKRWRKKQQQQAKKDPALAFARQARWRADYVKRAEDKRRKERERYANDPEYRERKLAGVRAAKAKKRAEAKAAKEPQTMTALPWMPKKPPPLMGSTRVHRLEM